MVSHEQKMEHFQHMYLKTVVKESHATSVSQLVFNHVDGAEKRNLFATVGKDYATIYDDQHFDSYIDVVAQFVNAPTDHTDGGDLLTCCWLSSKNTEEEFGDALLAVAGKDNTISVISVVNSAVVKLLKGHDKEITDLTSSAARPELLVSTSKDGTTRMWDWNSEICLQVMDAHASVACFTADGTALVTGSREGDLHSWALPSSSQETTGAKRKRVEISAQHLTKATGAQLLVQHNKEHSHATTIDCIRTLPNGDVITKSVDGRLFVWDSETMERKLAIKVPGCPPGNDASAFGLTPSGEFVAAGNASGDVLVYDLQSGQKVCHLKAERIKNTPVRSCGITDDCKHVLAVYGAGFIWRYEYIAPQPEPVQIEETPDEAKEAAEMGADA